MVGTETLENLKGALFRQGLSAPQRIFILGNGPSLLDQAHLLVKLTAETTFCCNRMVQWNLPFIPTYYACSAGAVLKGVEPENPACLRYRFIVSRRRDELERMPDSWVKVYKKERFPLLGTEPTSQGVKGGGTMVAIMAQLAIWMGYGELYFLGIEQRGSGHVFNPNGSSGFPYFIPDEDVLFSVWREVKGVYETQGAILRDCTPDGRLNEILGYVPLAEVMA